MCVVYDFLWDKYIENIREEPGKGQTQAKTLEPVYSVLQ